MSLATWKKEFYPIKANKVSKKNAVAHSIQKWKGLLPENLCKHCVSIDECGNVTDGSFDGTLGINTQTCALCFHFGPETDNCDDCPLFQTRSGHNCDDTRDGEQEPPFGEYRDDQDPMPMLAWLLLTQELQNEQSRAKSKKRVSKPKTKKRRKTS